MRRILNLVRSNNFQLAFFVVQDSDTNTMEVWLCNPSNNRENVHCHTFPFVATDNDRARAQRHAKSLAWALSRLSVPEALRQLDHLKEHGSLV